jgi:rod shape-determining protein MreC
MAALAICVVIALLLRASTEAVGEPVARALRSTVLAPLLALQQGAERSRHAWLTYRAMSAARDSLAFRIMEARASEEENARLRSVIGLGARLRTGFVVAEALHGQPLGEEYTLTLTAGSLAGVTERAPVIAADGLVGMVRTVDPTLSVAILTPHPKFAASARSLDSTAIGIVSPHLGSDPERFLLEMRNVGYRTVLPVGTLIVTTGIGGTYPEGIPIGTVIGEVKTPEEGWSRTYLVRPSVRPSDVSSVIILRAERAAAGVGNVWATRDQADSAARSVAAVGDSVQRAIDAAMAAKVAAARQFVRDSVAAVSPGSWPPAIVPSRGDATRGDSGRVRVGRPPPAGGASQP